MDRPPSGDLSRRQRQIMDLLYREGELTVAGVREELPDPPSESAVRSALNLLEKEGHVDSRKEGRRKVYAPRQPQEKARREALTHLLRTFFQGSAEAVVNSLLSSRARDLSADELRQLEDQIRKLREHRERDSGVEREEATND